MTIIGIKNYPDGLEASATEINKQKSKQVAALNFLDKIFNQNPISNDLKYYSWNRVLKEVSTKKKPLTGII